MVVSLGHLSICLTARAPEDSVHLSPEKPEPNVDHATKHHHHLLPKHHYGENSHIVGVQTIAQGTCRSHCHGGLRSSSGLGPREPTATLPLGSYSSLSPVSFLPEDAADPRTPNYNVCKEWVLEFLGILVEIYTYIRHRTGIRTGEMA